MKRFFRYYQLRFKRLRGHPDIIARGIGVGLFVGITPTIPFHTAFVLTLCFPLRASKIAAFFSSWIISNPVTIFIQYYMCWWVGSLFFPGLLSWEKVQGVLSVLAQGDGYNGFKDSMLAISVLGFDAITVMLTGGLLLALPIALTGYWYSHKFFTILRNKRVK